MKRRLNMKKAAMVILIIITTLAILHYKKIFTWDDYITQYESLKDYLSTLKLNT